MSRFIIQIIKFYRYFISPLLGHRCRYINTCSKYYIEALNLYGLTKGTYLGFKRILSCHPIKFLGGGTGLENVPNKKSFYEENLNGK
jgi:uncharacterized protein